MARYDYHKKLIGDGYYAGRPKRKKNKLARSVFFLAVFAFTIALFVYVFPEVEVTIVPETETVINDFKVVADANLDVSNVEKNQVKARVVEVEDSMQKTFTTTGEKNVGEKAKGTAVFFNQTGLVQPLTTENKLVNDDGVVFFVTKPIEIPKAEVSAEGSIVFGTVSVEIEAAEAGEKGNINPGRLTIIDLPFSKQNKIYAEVQSKLNGGTTETIKVVSEDDLKNAERTIRDLLEPKLREKLLRELNENEHLENDLLQYEVVKVDKAVELQEEIEEFDLKVSMKARALVWNEKEIKQMLLKKIKYDKSDGKQLIKTSQDEFIVKVAEFNLDEGTALLKIHMKNQITMPINIVALKEDLKGKTEFDARRLLLEKSNIRDVRFKFRYSITSKIPNNSNRINVKLNL